jgi:hypothetical protein
MAGKEVEGNEEQRRAAAREARREGSTPSAEKVTTGASKQPSHLSRHVPHEEKVARRHEGKQQWQAEWEAAARQRRRGEAGAEPQVSPFAGRGRPGYTEAHEQVFAALTAAQAANGGDAVDLDEVARGSGLPPDQARALLHDLAEVDHLVTILQPTDTPDRRERFEEKPRL